jgi:hypothetical protein
MSDGIRAATDEELSWIHNDLDRDSMEAQTRREIEEARSATPTPRHWRPVEITEEPELDYF